MHRKSSGVPTGSIPKTQGVLEEAFLELIQRLREVAAGFYDPGLRRTARPHRRLRRLGPAEFVIDDAHQIIHVFDVLWSG